MTVPPIIAIIIRTADRPALLRRALESVLAQSFDRWRVVVVNDGGVPSSVDAELRALNARARGRFSLIHHAQRKGMEAATNSALAAIQEPLVTMLDDDDTWNPAFLDHAVSTLLGAAARGVRGVICRSAVVEEFDDGGTLREVSRRPFNPDLSAVSLDALCVENLFTNNAFVFERSAVVELGGFEPRLAVYGDWDFNLRFVSAFDVEVMPLELAHYHRRVSGHGPTANSFSRDPAVAASGRARLLSLWLRGENGRSPAVGTLLALGPAVKDLRDLKLRVDKVLDLLHRLRQLPVVERIGRFLRP